MGKGEISWVKQNEEGQKFQVYAHRIGDQWTFFMRQRRFDEWQKNEKPPLEDWLELLDGVKRRAQRRLVRPEEILRVEMKIHELFPEAEI